MTVINVEERFFRIFSAKLAENILIKNLPHNADHHVISTPALTSTGADESSKSCGPSWQPRSQGFSLTSKSERRSPGNEVALVGYVTS